MIPIAENPEAQLALLGNMIRDPRVFAAAKAFGISDEFFLDVGVQMVAQQLAKFHADHHRHPSPAELKLVQHVVDDPHAVADRRKTVDLAVTAAGDIAFVTIEPSLKEWRAVQVEVDLGNKIGDAKSAAEKTQLILDAADALRNVNSTGIVLVRPEAGSALAANRARRKALAGRLVPTGIPFVDDVIGGGVAPGTLTVITAATSVGKSQLLLSIATSAAKVAPASCRPISFALEAYDGEHEDRAVWPLVRSAYADKHGWDAARKLDGQRWEKGGYGDTLAVFEEIAEKCYLASTSTKIDIRYKPGTKFTTSDIEREVRTAAATGANFVGVDHLEFIDGEGDGEQWERQAEIMERLKSLAESSQVAIVVVVHTKKPEARRFQTLIPSTDDIGGSRNISKIAPTIIALAGTKGVDDEKLPIGDYRMSGHQPTLISVTKLRGLDGGQARTRLCAVCHYDTATATYAPRYTLGQLIKGDMAWESLYDDEVPHYVDRSHCRQPQRPDTSTNVSRFQRGAAL